VRGGLDPYPVSQSGATELDERSLLQANGW